MLTWRRWSDSSVFDLDGGGTGRSSGIVVGIEVVLAGAGAALLARTGRSRWTPPWIAFVVGVHFVPLASLLAYPLLYAVALATVVVAAAAVPLAVARGLAVSAVTGVGVGSVLLLAALASLSTVDARRQLVLDTSAGREDAAARGGPDPEGGPGGVLRRQEAAQAPLRGAGRARGRGGA